MKNYQVAVLILSTIFLTSNLCYAAEIYKWTDENGKVHFGDKPKDTETTEIYEEKKLPSIDSKKAKQIYVAPPSPRKNVSNNVSKSSKKSGTRCSRIKEEIKEIEEILRKRLRSGTHVHYDKKLSKLRWEKTKSC